ncbi:hypothetical protein [Streptomyces sp. NPDC091027]|uniref:hypothetical protein n=1 Tax=Streptomyces sp. NPDC091027 TaxID=3365971 RepID=UPI0037FE9810
MTGRPRPSLKSLPVTPTGVRSAEPARTPGGRGALKVVAEGVPSVCRPDLRVRDGRFVVAVLHICAPSSRAVPTAHSKCECGHDRSAVGRANVLALIQVHEDHRAVCPLGRVANARRKAA